MFTTYIKNKDSHDTIIFGDGNQGKVKGLGKIAITTGHLISISKLNDEVTSLNAQLKTCKSDFDKLKFARDAYTVGRHPSIKDGLGFLKEAKNLTSQRTPIFNKEKGKAPMASCIQKNHAFIYDRKVSRNTHYNRTDLGAQAGLSTADAQTT